MNKDLQEFEKQFDIWKNLWNEKKDLGYLNLESSLKTDLAHNLRVTSYRVDLGNKALFALIKQNCLHTLKLRDKLQEQADQLKGIKELSEIVKKQRSELKLVLQNQKDLKEEIQQLKTEYILRRPLSRQDVEKLVIKISEQPKETERQTEALVEELAGKVEKLEELIHHLRRSLFG